MGDSKKPFDAIVLFCSSFPFAGGEEFLEKEFPYMKEYGKRLILMPIAVKQYQGNRIKMDDCIIIVRGLRERLYRRMWTDFFCLFNLDFWKEAKTFFKEPKGISEWIWIVDYFAQFNRLSLIIKEILSHYISNKDRKILFYSYWFSIDSALASCLKTYYPNAISVSRVHSTNVFADGVVKGYVSYRKESLQHLDALFSVSDIGIRPLEKEFPNMKGHVFLSRLGTRDFGRNHLCVGDRFTIVSCSSMIPLKRVHLLIEALALHNQEVRWIHFGDGELRKELEQKARGLPDFVHWEFRGYIPNARLMEMYRDLSIDMFINVSSTEGIPVSIMEALSFGIPVMATDVGASKEAVLDGYNGKLLPADITPADLAKAIMDFREELGQYGDRYRNNARESWEKNYSAERNYTDFYEKVCALHGEICGKRNSGV